MQGPVVATGYGNNPYPRFQRRAGMTIRKYGRYWAVLDADGTLVCLCVYRKGAVEVMRRLQAKEQAEA